MRAHFVDLFSPYSINTLLITYKSFNHRYKLLELAVPVMEFCDAGFDFWVGDALLNEGVDVIKPIGAVVEGLVDLVGEEAADEFAEADFGGVVVAAVAGDEGLLDSAEGAEGFEALGC